jgi:hypothetical protein
MATRGSKRSFRVRRPRFRLEAPRRLTGEMRCGVARGQPPVKETSEFLSKSNWIPPVAQP